MERLRFGDLFVDRLVESEGLSFYPAYLLPDAEDKAVAKEKGWLAPCFIDLESGRLIMSVHTYVIQTSRHVVLVDTCVGNDKNRASTPQWHQQKTPWLNQLKSMGIARQQVDFVLCTHLHVDHVGWNTQLVDGRWVPTFPNAKYLFHKIEYDTWKETGDSMAVTGKGDNDGCFVDSVLPVMESGQALLVDGDHQIDENLWLESTPGHTLGHVSLHLQAGGRTAVFCGDLMHHPLQCAYPLWNSRFCADPALARLTRHRFLDDYAETGTVILAAHFAFPTAGRIVKDGSRFCFQAIRGENTI